MFLRSLRFLKLGAALICIALLAGCGRAEGSKYIAGELIASTSLDASLPPNVDPLALTAIINYIDAVNIGLHTGKTLPIRMAAMAGCGCLKIADSFEDIWATANLVGGSYKITSIEPVINTPELIKLKVRVAMSDTKHVDRKSGKSEFWEASNIDTTFTLKPVNGDWWIEASE